MVITYNDKKIVSKEMKRICKYDLKKSYLPFFIIKSYINVNRIGQNLIND